MRRQGFTLIELMVVVLIVAVLAAILAPMMMARLEAARWAEGKAGCGTLATAIRATFAEYGESGIMPNTGAENYLRPSDLRGKYFSIGDYTVVVNVPDPESESDYPVHYTISVGQPQNPADPDSEVSWKKAGYKLNHKGTWTELPSGG